SSTHNTRIERLWVEVGSQFGRAWRAFFFRLEGLHGLDRKNRHHLWLLHTLFLDEINNDCKEFQENWNAHPISGEGHDCSPNDLIFLGRLEHGAYEDCPDVHVDLLNRCYGVHGKPIERQTHQTGAGHPADEEETLGTEEGKEWHGIHGETDTDNEEWAGIFNQEAIEAPKHADPFQSGYYRSAFTTALEQLKESGQIPTGYGIHHTEWDAGYPSFGVIRSGRRGRKELRIALPDSIWRPRSLRWVQGLYLMNQLI
ncbi:hypothetical protein C8J55DRAFT_407249, partial [Lentinula edodes]